MQVTMTDASVRATMLPATEKSELASSVAVHASAVHAARPLKVPSGWQVAVRVPLLEYPASQVTVTVPSVTPVMLPAVEWSELASSVAVQASAVHAVRPLKVPSEPHVAVRVAPPEYPASHVTVIASPVTPVMAPAAQWSEFASSAAAHADAKHWPVPCGDS